MRVDAIYMAPVKSLAMNRVDQAVVDKYGIVGDRRFFMIDAQDKLFTVRDYFPFLQVHVEYDPVAERLALSFPDGSTAEGTPEPDDAEIAVDFHGHRDVRGRAVSGPFAEALSTFAGQPLRLLRVSGENAMDGFPISMVSRESLAALAKVAGRDSDDGRRFRQNVYFDGASAPHEEDTWIKRDVRVGADLIVRGVMQDERCVVTTRDPDTGEHEMNTLKLIASYRTDQPKQITFGVYFYVKEPGEISVGDTLSVS